MEAFFEKYDVELDEGHALDHIISKAEKARKCHRKGKDYDHHLKELSEMIDDFFKYRAED